MAGAGGSEEKKLLCCFVVANKIYYNFYALDLSKASGKGDDQNYGLGVGGGAQNCELGVGGDDQMSELSDGNDLSHLPHLPDPFLTVPKIRLGGKDGLAAFGLLDGILYMVGPDSEVYVFDTRDITLCQPPLRYIDCLTIGPEFKGLKPDPVVIPLAGKLFVFCGSLYPDREYTKHSIEVLDPEKKCWSPIEVPQTLIEFAEKVEMSENLEFWKPYLSIVSHATVGSLIVLRLSMLEKYHYELYILDAETLSWKIRVDDHPQMTELPFLGVNLFWNGIWCSQRSCGILVMKELECMEDQLIFPIPSKQVSRTRGKVLRVDDSTLLVFSFGMKCHRYLQPCPDYFKLDMVRVDKRKRDKDGVEKLTVNVVESKDFFFDEYNPDFKLAYCYFLS